MKMKKFIITSISVFTIFTMILSCGKDNITQNKHRFDYNLYNKSKTKILNFLDSSKLNKAKIKSKKNSKEEQALLILNEVNNEFNSNLELNTMDLKAIKTPDLSQNWQNFYLSNGYLNQEQVDLINTFGQDASEFGFDSAISNLKLNILNLNLTNSQFEEYNLLVNTLYLMNDYYNQSNGYSNKSSFSAKEKPSWWKAAGCAVAIAANAGATYALTACAIPNPTTPAACTAAVVGKVLGLAGVIFFYTFILLK